MYSKIIEFESVDYYKELINKNIDTSLIDARLDLVDEIPNFLGNDIVYILNTIIGLVVSIIYIFYNTNFLIFMLSILYVFFIPFITYKWHKKLLFNFEKYNDLSEKRINILEKRNVIKYGSYVNKIMNININDSDLNTKIYILSTVLQIILIILGIGSIIISKSISEGLLYSTIIYIYQLNENVLNINHVYILLKV